MITTTVLVEDTTVPKRDIGNAALGVRQAPYVSYRCSATTRDPADDLRFIPTD